MIRIYNVGIAIFYTIRFIIYISAAILALRYMIKKALIYDAKEDNNDNICLAVSILFTAIVCFLFLLLKADKLHSDMFLYSDLEYNLEAIANDKHPKIKYEENNNPYIVHYKNKHSGFEQWIYYLPKESAKEQDMEIYKLKEEK